MDDLDKKLRFAYYLKMVQDYLEAHEYQVPGMMVGHMAVMLQNAEAGVYLTDPLPAADGGGKDE